MRILSILTPKRPLTLTEIEDLNLAEEQQVWRMYAGDQIRDFYFKADPPKAMLVWEEENLETVMELVRTFPIVKAGFFSIELIHLGPWLPFQVLFRSEALLSPTSEATTQEQDKDR